MPAPIALFAFNRPEHVKRTMDALAANVLARESAVVIFCDGPRNDEEKTLTDQVRALCHAEAMCGRFLSVHVIAQEKNQGLASSIISGVTRMFGEHERVIVLEDDLLTSPYFLRYMNDGLNTYADNERVASIHGYCFPHVRQPSDSTFFLKGADCLGWATWKRAWAHFTPDAAALLAEIRKRREVWAFNRNYSYDYTGMLQAVSEGRVSSWAVRWLASTWLKDMYVLYPRESLVFHNGSDGSGTNCAVDALHEVSLASAPVTVKLIPVREDPLMAEELCSFLRTMSGGPRGIAKERLHAHYPRLYTWVHSTLTHTRGMCTVIKKMTRAFGRRAAARIQNR